MKFKKILTILFKNTKNNIDILGRVYILKIRRFSATRGIVEYKFLILCLILNKENYGIFTNSRLGEKVIIYKNISTGNILSMAKGLGYLEDKLIEMFIKLSPAVSNYKNRKMVGFMNNFMIPDHLNVE